jgi:hypothetical protein
MGNRSLLLLLLITLGLFVLSCQQQSHSSQQQWISLFNGKDLSGWTPKFKGFAAGVNYKDTFRVEDGLLTVSYDQWQDFDNQAFGHLFSQQSYSHYKIQLQYRFIGQQITQEQEYAWAYRNNGLMLHAPPAEYMDIEQAFPMSAEAQLLGGNGQDPRTSGNLCSPSTNIVKNGELLSQHCFNSDSQTLHGDQWVLFEAEVYGSGAIKHYINGKLVFEYSELQADPSDPWGKKWLEQGHPIKLTKGHIALQAETHPVQFRNIRLRSLD